MGTGSDAIGRAITRIAALERGQAVDVVATLLFDPTGLTIGLFDGRSLRLPYDGLDAALAVEAPDVARDLAAAVATPEEFPREPLTAHQKWTELLEDIGGWHGHLSGFSPGLRLVSIRRAGRVAEIVVADQSRSMGKTIPLDDGLIVVGINDDLAIEFGVGSGGST